MMEMDASNRCWLRSMVFASVVVLLLIAFGVHSAFAMDMSSHESGKISDSTRQQQQQLYVLIAAAAPRSSGHHKNGSNLY